MRYEYRLPDVGEGIAEAEIVEYLVKAGETVRADQNVVRIETDKALVELPSPVAGVVVEIPHKSGDLVRVGEVILVLDAEGGVVSAGAPAAAPAAPSPPRVAAQEVRAPAADRVLATPHTRRLARELGVEIETVKGTGSHGHVTDADLRAAAGKTNGLPPGGDGVAHLPPAPAAAPSPGLDEPQSPAKTETGPGRRLPLKGIRKKTAEAMAKSWATIPHVTHADEADVTDLFALVARAREFGEANGVKVTALAFVAKAVVAALKAFPSFNASLDDERGEIVLHDHWHLGIATDTEAGLLVPVVRDADRRSVRSIAAEIQALGAKARDRTVGVDDLRGGTFTITNIGGIGGAYASPIILHPQVAILGLMRAQKKPVVRGDDVVVRTMMPLCLSFDHRVNDGAQAARFVNHVKRLLEDPARLFFEE